VAVDYVQAYKYFSLAGEGGDEVAYKYRALIAKRLSPAQLKEAQEPALVRRDAHRKK
jgi:hypothetical protein